MGKRKNQRRSYKDVGNYKVGIVRMNAVIALSVWNCKNIAHAG